MSAPLGPLLDLWHRAPAPRLDGVWAVAAGARAYAIAGLHHRIGGPLLVIVPGEVQAEELSDDIGLFSDDVVLAPAWETLPFEHVSPNTSTMAMRAEARHRLATEGVLVVASLRSAIQRLSPSSVEPVVLGRADVLDPVELAARLADHGYHRTDRVETRGEFAVRGGIVDVFPAQSASPVRLDFWGDQLDDIRLFSVASQRSGEASETMVAYPARELRPDARIRALATELIHTEPWASSTWERIAHGQMAAGVESWLPWLAPPACLVDDVAEGGGLVVVDPARVFDRVRDLIKEEAELAAALA
ncbi:MAG: transcription-repair coupling factor, partial [Actinobacteria bacterium]|nr:transcription-repair coupling factor [Actinomycetota bacterium]